MLLGLRRRRQEDEGNRSFEKVPVGQILDKQLPEKPRFQGRNSEVIPAEKWPSWKGQGTVLRSYPA
jgi:hypothetical protein